MHDEHRRVVEQVAAREVLGLAQLVLGGKRAVVLREILGGNSFRHQEFARGLLGRGLVHAAAADHRQRMAIRVDFAEDLGVQLVEQAERLDREEKPRVLARDLVPDDGHALQHDPVRLRLLPGLEPRLERVAMATAVPESLDDLDLARRRADRLRDRVGDEVLAFLPARDSRPWPVPASSPQLRPRSGSSRSSASSTVSPSLLPASGGVCGRGGGRRASAVGAGAAGARGLFRRGGRSFLAASRAQEQGRKCHQNRLVHRNPCTYDASARISGSVMRSVTACMMSFPAAARVPSLNALSWL